MVEVLVEATTRVLLKDGYEACTTNRVAEVAVNWADQPGSKVGVLRDGPRMLREVLAARRRISRLPRGGRAS